MRTSILLTTTVMLLVGPASANADPHPWNGIQGAYLQMPADGEWDHVAVDPLNDRVIFGDYSDRIVVVDTLTNETLETVDLNVDGEALGGVIFGPNGRLFVTTDSTIIELDPATYAELERELVEWSYTGPMAITSDGQTGYVAGGDDLFVVDLSAGIELLDFDDFDGWETGLLGLHPEWASEFQRAWQVLLSPDDDRLYFVGDPTADEEGSLQYIDGLASGDLENGLTLTLHPLELRESWPTSPPIRLNADGTLLFDALGNVWETSSMTSLGELPLTEWDGLQAEVIVPSPSGNAVFVLAYGQLYNQQDRTEWSGEQILVADPFDYRLLDLDDDAQTGLVGIDLPNGGGWTSLYAWNHYELVVRPDGQALYLAGGSSGAFVVDLTGAHISAVQPSACGDAGECTVRISGNFEEGSTVILQSESADPREATVVAALPGGALEARFELTGAEHRTWDVVINQPTWGEAWIPEGLLVEEARLGASVDLAGTIRVRGDESARIHVHAQNTGNNDLIDPVVTLLFTPGMDWLLELPSIVLGGPTQRDAEFTAGAVEPALVWMARLPPGRSYGFWLELQAAAGTSLDDAEQSIEASIGFIGPVEDPEDENLKGPVGAACGFLDTLMTNFGKAIGRRGFHVTGDVEGVLRETVVGTIRDTAVSKVKGMIEGWMDNLVASAALGPAAPIALIINDVKGDIESCATMYKNIFSLFFLFPMDPNDKVSATGIDGYLTGIETLHYVIHFENLPEATAEARRVTITDPIDDDLDLGSFELLASSHPEVLSVDVDTETRVITFLFDGIDLPPNVTAPEGQGWVEFAIELREDLPSGAEITNGADIIFDTQEPIVTPVVRHEIDRDPPNSAVVNAPLQAPPTFTLEWDGIDGGVGVWDYSVLVSRNFAEWEVWIPETEETSAVFEGELEHIYAFEVIARDRLGWTEAITQEPEAVIAVVEGAGIPDGGLPDTGVPSYGGDSGGCGCVSGPQRSGAPWYAALLVAGLVLRRHPQRDVA